MLSKFFPIALPWLSLFAFGASSAVRHPATDARAGGILDEIAKRRESRVFPIAPARMIHEPQRFSRSRGGNRPTRSPASPIPFATGPNAPVSYTGFLGLLDNF